MCKISPPKFTNEDEGSEIAVTDCSATAGAAADSHEAPAPQARQRAPPVGLVGEENSFELEFPEVKTYDRFLCKARALKSKKELGQCLPPDSALLRGVILCHRYFVSFENSSPV